MTIVIGGYDLATSTVGQTTKILLTPNLSDSADTYPPGGLSADQEDRRLERGVIAEIEELVEAGLQATTRVEMRVNQVTTPRWDNQVKDIFFNAARGRISTHQFTSTFESNKTIRVFGVETLP